MQRKNVCYKVVRKTVTLSTDNIASFAGLSMGFSFSDHLIPSGVAPNLVPRDADSHGYVILLSYNKHTQKSHIL
jgi:hypothetical protein